METPTEDQLAKLAAVRKYGTQRRPCAVPDCKEPHHARGLCKNHYANWRYYQQHP